MDTINFNIYINLNSSNIIEWIINIELKIGKSFKSYSEIFSLRYRFR